MSTETQPSYIANSVFNAFPSYTAITMNGVTIYAIRKTSSLPRALKTLLLSLAVSDLGVGLLCQPFYVALMIDGLQGNTRNCTTYTAFTIFVTLFSVTSFLGTVTALIVDRFLAIHLHLRYQELVTHQRVVAAVISIWVLGVSCSLLLLLIPQTVTSTILGVVGIFCFITSAFLNYKIYSTVKSYANQIQPLPVQQDPQDDEIANIARLRKSAVGTFYIYLVFLLCYLPQIFSFIPSMIFGSSFATKRLVLYSLTLIFLNSFLNPLIYFWKMRHIRHAIMDIPRRILRSQN